MLVALAVALLAVSLLAAHYRRQARAERTRGDELDQALAVEHELRVRERDVADRALRHTDEVRAVERSKRLRVDASKLRRRRRET